MKGIMQGSTCMLPRLTLLERKSSELDCARPINRVLVNHIDMLFHTFDLIHVLFHSNRIPSC